MLANAYMKILLNQMVPILSTHTMQHMCIQLKHQLFLLINIYYFPCMIQQHTLCMHYVCILIFVFEFRFFFLESQLMHTKTLTMNTFITIFNCENKNKKNRLDLGNCRSSNHDQSIDSFRCITILSLTRFHMKVLLGGAIYYTTNDALIGTL